MIRKCGLFALSFALLLTVLYAPYSAKAASDYDNTLSLTDKLIVDYDYAAGNSCDQLDITATWASYIIANPTFGESFRQALDTGSWSVSQETSTTYPGGNKYQRKFVLVTWMEYTNNSYTAFPDTNGLSVYDGNPSAVDLHVAYIYINGDSGCGDPIAGQHGKVNAERISNAPSVSDEENNLKLLLSTYPAVYPPGYEGPEIPDTYTPPGDKEQLSPDYSWSVSKDGKLKVKYLGNLPHFLTGISYLKVDKMNSDWDGVDHNIDILNITPGGWLDETVELDGAGYYMFDVSHNQQLDSPPWEENAADKYYIKQRWVQIMWDGKTAINGSTVGCTNSICNDFKDDSNPTWRIMNALDGLNTYGLQAFLLAPINFFQTLPAKVETCSPITFPLMGRTISLQCLKPMYYNWSPLVMNVYTVLFNATIAYWVAFNIFRHVKNINSPHKDQIEVAKL